MTLSKLPPMVVDMRGQKFNSLEPIEYLGGSLWKCICKCGKEVIARGQDIRRGLHKSCGCLQSDEDLAGQRFTRLVAIEMFKIADKHGRKWAKWRCICDCGKETIVLTRCLKAGKTKSCGCLNQETRTKHGLCKSPEYRVWQNMLQRCANPSIKTYHLYGGRGITVCGEWQDFETFLEDMGCRPSNKHSLDRRDNNGDYNKENCRWATRQEQNFNKRTNRHLVMDSETKTITEWCNQYGQQVAVVRRRIDRGMGVKEALLCR